MIRLAIFILLGLILFFLVRRLIAELKNNTTEEQKVDSGDDDSPENNTDVEPTSDLHAIGVVESVGSLPLWFNYEPDEANPAIYENTFWEIEPMGEYLYYLAGDYAKNQNGLLNYSSSSTVFNVHATLEEDTIDVQKHDGGNEQAAAETSPIDIDELLADSVGEVINRFKPMLESNPDSTQFVSLMHLLPEGAYGNARLMVNKNWISNKGLMLSLVYEEFRYPATVEDTERGTFIHAHCINMEQPLNTIMAQFIILIDRYKAMPYSKLSGATRY